MGKDKTQQELENETEKKKCCCGICNMIKKLLYYSLCCCILKRPLVFCFGKGRCKYGKCNDKLGLILWFTLWAIAISIWVEVIEKAPEDLGQEQLLGFSNSNLEKQIQSISKSSTIAVYYSSFADQVSALFQDLSGSLKIVFLASLASTLVSQLYMYILSFAKFRKVLQKVAIITLFFSGAGASYMLIKQASSVDGELIVIFQYTFAVITCVFSVGMCLYAVCLKKVDSETAIEANKILDKSAGAVNKYKAVVLVPLLFVILVIGWWMIFTWLFFMIYIVFEDQSSNSADAHFFALFSNSRLFFHLFMGIWILNSIYVFCCLIIARIICIVADLPSNYHDYELKKRAKSSSNADKKKRTGSNAVVLHDHPYSDEYSSKRCCMPILYAFQEVLSRHIGSIAIQAIVLIYGPPLVKLTKVFRISGKGFIAASKIDLTVMKDKCCGTDESDDDGKSKGKCRNKCLEKCCCNWCCCFVCHNVCLCRWLFKGCGPCCFFSNKCTNKVLLSELVTVNSISIQGLLSKNMINSFRVSNQVRKFEDLDGTVEDKDNALEDAVDQIADWALYVSEMWIPLFTVLLCLAGIEAGLFDIKDQLNSLLMPAFASLMMGIIIGNLYMAVFRFSAHLMFMDQMNFVNGHKPWCCFCGS